MSIQQTFTVDYRDPFMEGRGLGITINHPKCNEIDNIRHFYLFYPKVHNFWNSFFQWRNRMGDLEITADYDFLEECIIFGFHLRGEIFEVLNFCILIC